MTQLTSGAGREEERRVIFARDLGQPTVVSTTNSLDCEILSDSHRRKGIKKRFNSVVSFCLLNGG